MGAELWPLIRGIIIAVTFGVTLGIVSHLPIITKYIKRAEADAEYSALVTAISKEYTTYRTAVNATNDLEALDIQLKHLKNLAVVADTVADEVDLHPEITLDRKTKIKGIASYYWGTVGIAEAKLEKLRNS